VSHYNNKTQLSTVVHQELTEEPLIRAYDTEWTPNGPLHLSQLSHFNTKIDIKFAMQFEA